MRNRGSLPLRAKLLAAFLTLGAAVSLAATGAGLFFTIGSTREMIKERSQTLSDLAGYFNAAALAFGDRDEAATALAALRADRSVHDAEIYDAAGRLFAVYPAGHVAEERIVITDTLGTAGLVLRTLGASRGASRVAAGVSLALRGLDAFWTFFATCSVLPPQRNHLMRSRESVSAPPRASRSRPPR